MCRSQVDALAGCKSAMPGGVASGVPAPCDQSDRSSATASDGTPIPGLASPLPPDLWKPPLGATPPSGNYVYLEGDPVDLIAGGQTYTYTEANARLGAGLDGATITVGVEEQLGNWSGFFQVPAGLRTEAGYYGGLQRISSDSGGLAWSGHGFACNALTGWFAIDGISTACHYLTAVDLRFEQHCESSPDALRGQIHYVAD